MILSSFVLAAGTLIFSLGSQAAAPLKLSLNGVANCPSGFKRIYVSAKGDDKNIGKSSRSPIRTLWRAKGQSQTYAKAKPAGICILLRGSDQFIPERYFTLRGGTQTDGVDGDARLRPDYYRAAFVWDLNVPLVMTNYGQGRPQIIGSNAYFSVKDKSGVSRNSIKVQMAIAVTYPSKQKVILENLHIENWELQAISIFKAPNVEVRNNFINKVGTLFFPGEEYRIFRDAANSSSTKTMPIYTGGVILVKSSVNSAAKNTSVSIHHNYIKNAHNRSDGNFTQGDLHVFYIQKSSGVSLYNNLVRYTSGPPVKLDGNSSMISVRGNKFQWAAPSNNLYAGKMDQLGFIRIPCQNKATSCASKVEITDNEFSYPYCGSKEGCRGHGASLYSGQYFSDFAPVCSVPCWQDSGNVGTFCEDRCRGIKLKRNLFRADWDSSI